MLQVKLQFTENALRLIAKKAIAKNTGARGLRSILESILTEAMFEVLHDAIIFLYLALILEEHGKISHHFTLITLRYSREEIYHLLFEILKYLF